VGRIEMASLSAFRNKRGAGARHLHGGKEGRASGRGKGDFAQNANLIHSARRERKTRVTVSPNTERGKKKKGGALLLRPIGHREGKRGKRNEGRKVLVKEKKASATSTSFVAREKKKKRLRSAQSLEEKRRRKKRSRGRTPIDRERE